MNKCLKRHLSAALAVMVICAASPAQSQPADLKEVKELAEECGAAFMRGDFGRLADLTYPKAVEALGGKAKMVSALESELREMKAEGFEPVSYTVGEPKEVVRARAKLLVVVPTVLRMKVKEGVLAQRSYLLGVSAVSPKRWTFIDGSSLDGSRLKAIIPEAAGRLALPKHEEPVLERAP